jgi:hypothetical protein
MINQTSVYPTQTFNAPAQAQINAQINASNTSGVNNVQFPMTYFSKSFAGTAPDGSGAAMYQVDALINANSTYAFSSVKDAQQYTLQAAASQGNEFYIEISPLPKFYYSILTWASNI